MSVESKTLSYYYHVILRVTADTVMLAAAYGLAMVIRYAVAVMSGHSATALLTSFLRYYAHGILFLIPCCLISFVFFGFYGRGRYYRSRIKILVVFQGVTIGYLATGSLVFFFPEFVGSFSRGVLILSYFLAGTFLILARLWSNLWKLLHRAEALYPSEGTVKRGGPSRILVIGGAGYIGSALLPVLLEAGFRVRLMDIMVYGEEAIAPFKSHPNLEIRREDFRQVNSVVEAMQDIDTVIHLGAIVGDPACALDEKLTRVINLTAVRMIGEVAKGLRIGRFIFAGTCSVYGASDGILDEKSALNPISLYARTKIACERALLKLADGNFRPTVLRFGTIYGLSGRTRFDLVVNLLAAKAVVEGVIPISGGQQCRPFIHVQDAARAVYRAITAPIPVIGNEIFNVASNDQNYTIEQVAAMVKNVVPEAEVNVAPLGEDPRNYRVDAGKISDRLGFRARWSLEEGVRQVVDALRGGKITDWRDPRYSNARFLSEENGTAILQHDPEYLETLYLLSPSDRIEP